MHKKGAALPQKKGAPPYGINSWLLVAVSMVLIIFGLLLYNKMYVLDYQLITNEALLDQISPYWYIITAVGVLLFSFCFKVDKPDIGDEK